MARPILKYFGAKWSAAARIVPMLPPEEETHEPIIIAPPLALPPARAMLTVDEGEYTIETDGV